MNKDKKPEDDPKNKPQVKIFDNFNPSKPKKFKEEDFSPYSGVYNGEKRTQINITVNPTTGDKRTQRSIDIDHERSLNSLSIS